MIYIIFIILKPFSEPLDAEGGVIRIQWELFHYSINGICQKDFVLIYL